jgi:hypothetical protein
VNAIDKNEFLFLLTNYVSHHQQYIMSQKKRMRVRFTFKEEISDHDGYCSGNENEYMCRTYEKEVEVEDTELNTNIDTYWYYADKIDIGNRRGQSYYCTMSTEACEADLGPHDVRITVVKAEIINQEIINEEIVNEEK